MLDYSLCNQTVTIYHKEGEAYTKTVCLAFLDFRKNRNIEKTGSRETNGFLLIVPCTQQCVFVGDKVLLGEGADITTREQWATCIPAKVQGLVVVQQADPKYFGGKLVHVEAGG